MFVKMKRYCLIIFFSIGIIQLHLLDTLSLNVMNPQKLCSRFHSLESDENLNTTLIFCK